VKVFREHGVRLRLFHGAAAPWAARRPELPRRTRAAAGSVAGQLRLTSRARYREQVRRPVIAGATSATLVARPWRRRCSDAHDGDDDVRSRRDGRPVGPRLSRVPRPRLRDAGFIRYFREATPSTRSATSTSAADRQPQELRRIEDLRAIPGSSSWGQWPPEHPRLLRLRQRRARVRRQGRRSGRAARASRSCARCSRAGHSSARSVDKLEMVLAKTDMGIAARYAGLVRDPQAARRRSSAHQARARRHARRPSPSRARHAAREQPSLARGLQHRTPLHRLPPTTSRSSSAPLRAGRGDANEIRRAVHLTSMASPRLCATAVGRLRASSRRRALRRPRRPARACANPAASYTCRARALLTDLEA